MAQPLGSCIGSASALLFSLSLLFASHDVSADIRVVSDIDDTAKISNVGNPIGLAWNSFFSTTPFTGMKELYSSFAYERGYAFHYLTAAPSIYRGKVRRFLSTNAFPEGELHTRPLFRSETTQAYKVRTLLELFARFPADFFILIGDDTQKDAAAYDEAYRSAPDRVLAIYIHKVTNNPLPPSAYSYLSAYDIARTEYLMGRLQVWEASPVALSIIAEPRLNRVVPRFSYCPRKRPPGLLDPKVEEWDAKITERVETICKQRSLPEEIL
jgi:hypothetical protein